jgi:pyruvate formate lyase activating enzyme
MDRTCGRNKQGIVFNLQSFSIHDGPGIRTTMFTKGCQLHCPWCSNPESMDPSIQIKISAEKCRACGMCIDACAYGALSLSDNRIHLDHNLCTDCLACVDVCRSGCIARIGAVVGVDEAVEKLLKDRPFYEKTGGGVTISGGEPLLQHEFVSDVLRRLHELGVHTALDTSGFASWDALASVIEHVDLVLFDIKHLDRDKHRSIIGVDNEIILKNIRKCSSRARIWTRTPLVPGFNDDFEVADSIVDLARKTGAQRCYFLPLHRWGEHKYERIGLSNPYAHLREFLPEELAIWKERYKHLEEFVFFS